MRRIAAIMAVLMVWAMMGAYTLTAAAGSKIVIDGRELVLSNPPIQLKGMTWVPFRGLFEGLGLRVGWDAKTKQITGKSTTAAIEVRLGSLEAQVNGKALKLSAAPFTQSGVAYVPLRFVSEAVSRDVRWDRLTGVITIGGGKTSPTVTPPKNGKEPPAIAADQLTGSVLSPLGEPVAGAKVIAIYSGLNGAVTVDVTTDSNGRYEISGVSKENTMYVHAEPPLNSRDYMVSKEIKVLSSDRVHPVNITLQKVDVTGSVVDEEGKPVANQEVVLFEGESPTSDLTFITDANGQFRIGGLSIGKRYRILAFVDPIDLMPEPYVFKYGAVDPKPVIVVKQNFASLMAVNQDGKPIDTNLYSMLIRKGQNQFDPNIKPTLTPEAYIYSGLKPGDRYVVDIQFRDENSNYENPAPYSFTFDPSVKEPLLVKLTLKGTVQFTDTRVQFTDTIVDEQGNPIAHARVRIIDQASSQEKLFPTDGSGKVSISGLREGREYVQFLEPYPWSPDRHLLYGRGNKFIYNEGITSLPERTLYGVQLKIKTADIIVDSSYMLTIHVTDASGNPMPTTLVNYGYYGTGRLKEGETYKIEVVRLQLQFNPVGSTPDKPAEWKERPDPVTFVYKAGMDPIVLKSKTSS
ncbi:carboxypeptidase regulatory-like domain-containing protein [Paenibacillus mendelii]|uniref:Carboxypeptidase regulatory-like domain-containing protein n=1 Tax=Paenibacillus mendelii TaxID=206163 RepID=A0ABV6JF03_9BACL|nr:carboxypeptidase regulatory-like domain-containing protein [Paenibacillus mendelii]MCQ6563833.1 carboxypeptidase regulatory-like domain-containing protein [Paenibacillus mendelii]